VRVWGRIISDKKMEGGIRYDELRREGGGVTGRLMTDAAVKALFIA
jgi:hypothetical protein